ncbi:hypothetical protein K2173_018496 [Erythroxylum novogranatense]|uniref:Reverse transcriptase Ty1/copia-type domain-containing protein n=1 Tax=Erythroxylum novogranatense TaxID=1862640 RepID=A0AAV8UE03_9ROSI|nr:hypothetical protein K2173_018496 [Erythroxylum novogranatense]
MDVNNAILHGDLNEEVYMKLPPGFSSSDQTKVCKLKKSLYGLKQAPRYDLIIAGNDVDAIDKLKQYLSSCFHMKDLGLFKYFLGNEAARGTEGIFLSLVPIEQNHRLALADGTLMADPERYRRLVGRLIYLTITRPELYYSVHVLAQFMQNPRMDHWEAALRVAFFLSSDSDLRLLAYCDSDWASCPLNRRSLAGYVVLLGKSPISWKTKKQHTISRSSTEVEYRFMTTTTCELKWLPRLLQFLGVFDEDFTCLYCDSQAALHIEVNHTLIQDLLYNV